MLLPDSVENRCKASSKPSRRAVVCFKFSLDGFEMVQEGIRSSEQLCQTVSFDLLRYASLSDGVETQSAKQC